MTYNRVLAVESNVGNLQEVEQHQYATYESIILQKHNQKRLNIRRTHHQESNSDAMSSIHTIHHE